MKHKIVIIGSGKAGTALQTGLWRALWKPRPTARLSST